MSLEISSNTYAKPLGRLYAHKNIFLNFFEKILKKYKKMPLWQFY
jgi:hypothetical protein